MIDVIEVKEITLPFSEVCMHMKIAGTRMTGGLLIHDMVQLYQNDKPFSFPITRNEAGWDIQRG